MADLAMATVRSRCSLERHREPGRDRQRKPAANDATNCGHAWQSSKCLENPGKTAGIPHSLTLSTPNSKVTEHHSFAGIAWELTYDDCHRCTAPAPVGPTTRPKTIR